MNDLSLITQIDNIKQFDLIVLDEVEGLLNHLSFEKINQYFIHNILTRLLKKAPKVLCLDGDMNDRTFDFISYLTDDYKIYVNDYKTVKKHFIFTQSIEYFNENLEQDIQEGKKIVIVSMTKAETEVYRIMYNQKYKVIVHNSLEKNTNALKNANEEWSKVDILIYSPTVEAGVDYNIVKHFDKCYSVLSNRSTSYRAYSQMLNRVRYYNDNTIMCLMTGNIPWKLDEIIYRYDELRLCKYKGIEMNSLVNVLIHNDIEKINNSNYFMYCLIKLIEDKGHSYEYLDDKPVKRQKQPISIKDITIEEIIKADDIDDETHDDLNAQKIQGKEITREGLHALTKHYYKKRFLVDTIDEEFLKKHYAKLDVLTLYNRLIKDVNERNKTDNHYKKDFDYKKVDKILELVNKLGHEIKDGNIIKLKTIDYPSVEKEIISFINDNETHQIFNESRELKKENMLRVINDKFNNYGIHLTKHRKNVRTGDKMVCTYNIVIDFIEIIHGYRERLEKSQVNDVLNGMEEGVQL
jgi:hypothetical protein